jgi:hypothetical protein
MKRTLVLTEKRHLRGGESQEMQERLSGVSVVGGGLTNLDFAFKT